MLAATQLPAGIADAYLQLGVLGIQALLGLWFGLTAYRREVKRADAAEQALAALNLEMRESVIPALTGATHAVTECVQFLRDNRNRG